MYPFRSLKGEAGADLPVVYSWIRRAFFWRGRCELIGQLRPAFAGLKLDANLAPVQPIAQKPEKEQERARACHGDEGTSKLELSGQYSQ